MVRILTIRENKIIEKKIKGISLTQNESNILSRNIRPKLIEANRISSKNLLRKLEYNQKARAIENRIKNIILKDIQEVEAIILCGSAIQTNYTDYNDIDVIIATRRALVKNTKDKLNIIKKVTDAAKIENLKLDIQIYSKDSIIKQYPTSPSLIYQLKDSKVIYGNLKIPHNTNLSILDLKIKLDWSDIDGISSSGNEIYLAIRNALLVLLLMNKKVDNNELKNSLFNILGADLAFKLKNNLASKIEKRLALNYLKLLLNYMEEELKNPKWEKIVIENL